MLKWPWEQVQFVVLKDIMFSEVTLRLQENPVNGKDGFFPFLRKFSICMSPHESKRYLSREVDGETLRVKGNKTRDT